MRSSGEVSVTAPDRLAGRFSVSQPDLATALARADLRFVSCLLWRTAPDWSIPPRRLDDTFLFLPVSGRLVCDGPAGSEPLAPGSIALIPHGTLHAVRYAPGQRVCTVLALHLHLLTTWGTPWLGEAGSLVARLPGQRRWPAELTRLAGVAHDHPELGAALGRLLVGSLLAELALAGHPLRPPAQDLDPRLAAIVAQVQADPGATPPLTALARAHGIGPLRLRQLFHADLGCAPKAFIDRLRLARARELLRAGRTVGDTAHACGFGSLRQLQTRFKAAFGVPPSAWAAGDEISL
jgi:AraC-like DNA-binding protein